MAILFKKIRPPILRNRLNLAKLREAIEPINGFEWSMALIDSVWTKPIGDITDCIKSSMPPLEEIHAVRKLFKEKFWGSEIISPESWGILRAAIEKFHLYEIWPFLSGFPKSASLERHS